jgi:hypothetical protein
VPSAGLTIASADYNAELTNIIDANNAHVTVINDHDDRIVVNEADIVDAQADITALESTVGSHTTTLTAYGTSIGNNTTWLGYDASVYSANGDVDDRLDALEAVGFGAENVYDLTAATLDLNSAMSSYNSISCQNGAGNTAISLGDPTNFNAGRIFYIMADVPEPYGVTIGTASGYWAEDVVVGNVDMYSGQVCGLIVTNEGWAPFALAMSVKQAEARAPVSGTVTLNMWDKRIQYIRTMATGPSEDITVNLPSIGGYVNDGKEFVLIHGSNDNEATITITPISGDKIWGGNADGAQQEYSSVTLGDGESVTLVAVATHSENNDTSAERWVVTTVMGTATWNA